MNAKGELAAWVSRSEPLQGQKKGTQVGVEVGLAGLGEGTVCFQDNKCLLMGGGLHRALIPDRVVYIDFVATKPVTERRGSGRGA